MLMCVIILYNIIATHFKFGFFKQEDVVIGVIEIEIISVSD